MKRWLAAFLTIAVLGGILAGCSGGGEATEGTEKAPAEGAGGEGGS
ncbi:MAG: hypothetical protein AKCLJLPJ_00951 [Fimbriimonadales bacterium]|nr:hypothetical protein [Fimbriimonadales bacterium]